jgi:hypothetical protein
MDSRPKTTTFLLKALLITVKALNWGLSEMGYRVVHLIISVLVGLSRFHWKVLPVFLLFYFLVLELFTERWIFKKSKRKALYSEGKEIIEMIKEKLDSS